MNTLHNTCFVESIKKILKSITQFLPIIARKFGILSLFFILLLSLRAKRSNLFIVQAYPS
jgi:hypothetical protein